MADFCKQCADDLGFPESDLIFPNLRKGEYMPALCEGCGAIQVNSKGECISSDCLCPGHHVPMDKDVKYYSNNPNFNFSDKKVIEIGYGEWSHTIPEEAIEIDSIDDINGNIGDMISICHEGTYILLKIVSDAFLKGFDSAICYSISGDPSYEDFLKNIPEEDKKDFKTGWDHHFIKIT